MILIIGYGSLMSYFGIQNRSPTRDIKINNPFIVKFYAKRGFNTKSGHYMDIGINFNPNGFYVNIDNALDLSKNNIECLGFFIKDEDFMKISEREGYPYDLIIKFQKVYGQDAFKNLWSFYPDNNDYLSLQEKIHSYREKLKIIEIHSYFPHPVKIFCQNISKNYLGVISIHTDVGAKGNYNQDINLMTIREAIKSNNPPRDTYFQECILGGVHGINVRDLLFGMDREEIKNNLINFEENILNEWKVTQNWKFHGDNLLYNLKRSGLGDYFPKLYRIANF